MTDDDIRLTTVAERPHLADRIFDVEEWPEFMRHSPTGNGFFGRLPEVFPEFCVIATQGESETPVAGGFSIPFALSLEGRGALPPGGWERVLVWGFQDKRNGTAVDSTSALAISVDPAHQGKGLSALMLDGLRAAARAQGMSGFYAPVRPNWKSREPHTPMGEYIARTRPDGLPYDPWLRVHIRAGGSIVCIAPTSMTVAGSLAEWREWTGLPFDQDGLVDVEGALAPVRCSIVNDNAVYVEPNVWIRHQV